MSRLNGRTGEQEGRTPTRNRRKKESAREGKRISSLCCRISRSTAHNTIKEHHALSMSLSAFCAKRRKEIRTELYGRQTGSRKTARRFIQTILVQSCVSGGCITYTVAPSLSSSSSSSGLFGCVSLAFVCIQLTLSQDHV